MTFEPTTNRGTIRRHVIIAIQRRLMLVAYGLDHISMSANKDDRVNPVTGLAAGLHPERSRECEGFLQPAHSGPCQADSTSET